MLQPKKGKLKTNKAVNVGMFNLQGLMNNMYSNDAEADPGVQAIRNTFQGNMVQSA